MNTIYREGNKAAELWLTCLANMEWRTTVGEPFAETFQVRGESAERTNVPPSKVTESLLGALAMADEFTTAAIELTEQSDGSTRVAVRIEQAHSRITFVAIGTDN